VHLNTWTEYQPSAEKFRFAEQPEE